MKTTKNDGRGKKNPPMLLDTFTEDVKQKVIELSLPPHSLSAQKLSEWIKEHTGKHVSHMSVRKWLERRSATIGASIYGSKEFKEETGRIYGEVLGEYFECLKRMIQLEKQVCVTRELDLMAKTKCAVDLFNVIKEGTLVAKDLIVGEVGADKSTLDLESELERIEHSYPMVSIKPNPIN